MKLSIWSSLISVSKKHLFEESCIRIKQCLSELTKEEIWYSFHENHNSVGNIILHLLGNIQQYIVSGIGTGTDIRDRPSEFDSNPMLEVEELIHLLDQMEIAVVKVLDTIQSEELLDSYHIQCYDMTPIEILMHVVEHFSYHTGQIVFYTKYLKDVDTGFYHGVEL